MDNVFGNLGRRMLLALAIAGMLFGAFLFGSTQPVQEAAAEQKNFWVFEVYIEDAFGNPVQGAEVIVELNTSEKLGPEHTGDGNGVLYNYPELNDSGWARFSIPAVTGQDPYPSVTKVEVEGWLVLEVSKYPNLGELPVWTSPGTVTALKVTVGRHPAGTLLADYVPREEVLGPNQNPICVALALPASGQVPLSVLLWGNQADPDGVITSQWWEPGDASNPSWNQLYRHVYQSPGKYVARHTGTNHHPGQTTCNTEVEVLPPTEQTPEPTPTSPSGNNTSTDVAVDNHGGLNIVLVVPAKPAETPRFIDDLVKFALVLLIGAIAYLLYRWAETLRSTQK